MNLTNKVISREFFPFKCVRAAIFTTLFPIAFWRQADKNKQKNKKISLCVDLGFDTYFWSSLLIEFLFLTKENKFSKLIVWFNKIWNLSLSDKSLCRIILLWVSQNSNIPSDWLDFLQIDAIKL